MTDKPDSSTEPSIVAKTNRALNEFRQSFSGKETTYYGPAQNGELKKSDAESDEIKAGISETKAQQPQTSGHPADVYIDTAMMRDELAELEKCKRQQAPHVGKILNYLNTPDPKSDLKDKKTKPGVRSRSAGQPYMFGLAFSGGGIRSAIFCLGVMQKMAAEGLLKHVDYMSTVSGGGYTGTALAWWLSGKAFAGEGSDKEKYDVGEHLPFGIQDPKEVNQPSSTILDYLRQNGKYLIPGGGITVMSGLAIVLRAVLLNLIVWLPLVTLLFVIINWLEGTFYNCIYQQCSFGVRILGIASLTPAYAVLLISGGAILAFYILSCLGYSLASHKSRAPATERDNDDHSGGRLRLWLEKNASISKTRKYLSIVVLFLLGAIILSSYVFLIGFIANQLSLESEWLNKLENIYVSGAMAAICVIGIAVSIRPKWLTAACAVTIAAAAGIVLLVYYSVFARVFLFVLLTGFAVLLANWLSEKFMGLVKEEGVSQRYSGRRNFEELFGIGLTITIALIIVGSIPIVSRLIETAYIGAAAQGSIGILGGIASGLWGFVKMQGKNSGGRSTGFILIVGALLFLYGILVSGFALAGQVWPSVGENAPRDTSRLVQLGFWVAVATAIVTGWFTNLNYISLGRFYRDRLMEAFMPDWETVTNGKSAAAKGADSLKVSQLWCDQSREWVGGPYPIINTNVVLVNSPTLKYRARGGDNFAISPRFCGSNATGWNPTKEFDGDQMTLASAMAVSGAAANPRGGVGGKGLTTNKAVSIVMTLLNFRLGYWVNRPGKNAQSWLLRRPSHFYPSALYSLPGVGYTETSSFLELSDGGHFENLGVYELVRRRCGLIIVCDGGQDNTASYSDFVTLIQRIGSDFGAKIDFETGFGPELLVARPVENVYPKNAEYSERGYFTATIDYGDRGKVWPTSKGFLIYLKTAMIDDLSMTAKGYRGAHADFPDQSTADQFFDEEQFEAYREVGYRIAEQMVKELKITSDFKDGKRPNITENWIKQKRELVKNSVEIQRRNASGKI